MVSENVRTFALAFEKSSITRSNIKKEFFERFYINRQVVQEAVLDYTLLYIGSMKRLGKKETNRQAIDKSGLLSFNKRKGYSS